MIETTARHGVLGSALQKGLVSVSCVQPREFTADLHRSVDDRPYGGGDGMILLPEILEPAVARLRQQGAQKVIYLSPQGPVLNDRKVRELAQLKSVALVCGRYGGVDQRALNELIDEELSIGDYVLAGGELAALVVIESVARMIPGVLGHGASADQDSFSNGLLEHPHFTRPREWKGLSVPAPLLSGHHALIQEWKHRTGQLVTLMKRPELLEGLPATEWRELRRFWQKMSPEDLRACGFEGLKSDDFPET